MRRLLTVLVAALTLTACAVVPSKDVSSPSTQASESCASSKGELTTGDSELRLTVATYNVLGGSPPRQWFPQIDPAELEPMVRVPSTVAKIEHLNADVIGLQEFRPGSDSGVRLAAELSEFTFVAPVGEAVSREAVAVPILYRTDRFDLLDTGNERVTAGGQDGAWIDRNVNWVELCDRTAGRRFFVFNYHAHPRQTIEIATLRSVAIGRMVDVIERVNPGLAEPFVITGDFNARNDETRPTYRDHIRKLGRIGVVDAATISDVEASDVPRASSLNKMSAKVAGEEVGKAIRRYGLHIDYVWVPEDAKVRRWAIVSGPNVSWQEIGGSEVPVWDGIVPSDHSPVVAEVQFS